MTTKTIIITTMPAPKAGIRPFATIRKAPIVSDMSGIISKIPATVQLTSVPSVVNKLKRPASNSWENVAPNATTTTTSVIPRKRERLTHLSCEEKVNRRKLKNRIAAQTARDRKKVKMGVLEESVDQLENDNDALQLENDELHRENERLLEENTLLKKQLEEAKASRINSQPVAVGSAASISGPLPREQATAATLIWTLLITLLKPSSETSSKTSIPILKEMDLNSNCISLETAKEHLSSEQLEMLLEELWKAIRKRAPP